MIFKCKNYAEPSKHPVTNTSHSCEVYKRWSKPFAEVTWIRMYSLSCGSSSSCCAFASAVKVTDIYSKDTWGNKKSKKKNIMLVPNSVILILLRLDTDGKATKIPVL